jgi:hypothetical protein
MHASPKKFNTPNRGASQNQLIRTNHSRRIQLLGDNGNGLVAQGAALVAGPEAFFSLSVPPTIPEMPRRTKRRIMNTCASTHVTPAECALTAVRPNSFVMNTYKKSRGRAGAFWRTTIYSPRSQCTRGCHVAQPLLAVRHAQRRDVSTGKSVCATKRRTSAVGHGPFCKPLNLAECALTEKGGRGVRVAEEKQDAGLKPGAT